LVSREELYRLVWAEPMSRIGERFGVSGSYMARVCGILNVPRPERGYWAKLAVGKAPPQPPLPEARPGDPLEWSKDRELRAAPRPAAPPPRRRTAPIRIAPGSVHGLVRGAKAHFEAGRPVEDGAYLKPFKKLLVDVTASKQCLDKALELANDLFNALESVGHRVVLASVDSQLHRSRIDEREVATTQRDYYHHSGLWTPQRPTVVYVGTVAIGLAIVEMSEQVVLRYINGKYIRESDYVPPKRSRHSDYSWTTTREVPSGRLRVIAYSPYGRVDGSTDWRETGKTSLRSTIPSIVSAMGEAAPALVEKLEEAARQAEIAHRRWLEEEERRRREEDRYRTEQSVRESREQLAEVIQQWSSVTTIEQFLTGVEERAAELTDRERAPVFERLTRAREFLGSQDPLDFLLAWRTPEERYKPKYPRVDQLDEESEED
jgi:hypothetical protein